MNDDPELSAVRGTAFIDGRYVPLAEASVPILDRGFVRSDATYDVAHVWKGRFFRLKDHLERFEASMAGLRMSLPYSRQQIGDIMIECVRRSGLRDAYVQVTCTRGLPPAGTRDPRLCRNRLYAFAQPFVRIADDVQQRDGLKMILAHTQRIPSAAVDQRIKNFHWLDLTMGIFEAYDRGGETVVLTDGAGHVTEGPGFNVFAVLRREGRPLLVTPASGVLEGISRKTALELARNASLEYEVRNLDVDELRAADEVFLTSSGGGIIPVARVDGVPVAGREPGQFGPIAEQLRRDYWALHGNPRYCEPVDYGN